MLSKATTAKPPTKTVLDALGREIRVPRTVRRVVSLVPSLTDLCFELGAGDRVVGISDVCTEPRGQLDGIPRVGGEKRPSLEVIRSLRPDLVLANKEENRRQDVDRLRDSGIAVFVSHPCTVEEGASLCLTLGGLLGAGARGRALAAEIRRARAEGRRRGRAAAPGAAPVVAVVFVWRDPFMTISGDTYGHDVLACIGGQNPFAGASQRYPKVTLEAVARQRPKLILLPDEPYGFGPQDADQVRGAIPGAKVVLCPGRPLFWHGPRAREIPALSMLVATAMNL
jgi:ABC-type Fe3+-hydroxamate transport system substrate-binding protein